MSEIVSARELSDRLKLTLPTIYRLVRQEKLPHFRAGGSYRFDYEEVIATLKGEDDDEDNGEMEDL